MLIDGLADDRARTPARAPQWLLLTILATSLVLVVRTGARMTAAPSAIPVSSLRSDFVLDVGLVCLACTLLATGRAQRMLSVATVIICLAGVTLLFVK